MKKIDKLIVFLSLISLTVIFSLMSLVAAPSPIRYTWKGINPLNGIEGVYSMFEKYLGLAPWLTGILSGILILLVWWRLYTMIKRFIRK
ncbi:MAG: hypothetical protein SOY65_03165 [Marinifilaceae bacterium]|nr:hypothetical protein [Marinifilaceae bacterium]